MQERAAAPPPEGYLDKPVNEKILVRNVRKILAVGQPKSQRDARTEA